MKRFTHTAFQVVAYESFIALAERLNKRAPFPGPAKTIFFTTGAEAVENAVKIARSYTKRTAIISFSGAFHGRTLMTMGLTGKVVPYKAGFGPFPAEIYHVPFPMTFHGVTVEESLHALETLFKSDVEPARVAAIIIEPVQGEGGFYIAPKDFMTRLRELCDRHGIVLIADEIQSGAARTGRMFAMEHYDVAADLCTLAKSIAGGFPLSAVVGRAEIMDACGPGGLGGTYAGSPLSCAAALAAIDVVEHEKLAERALRIGDLLDKRVRALSEEPAGSCIGDIRHLGAMAAIELVTDRKTHAPDADLTKAIVQKAATKGLILLSCGIRGNVVRFLPPLTASDELINEAMDILRDTLLELRG